MDVGRGEEGGEEEMEGKKNPGVLSREANRQGEDCKVPKTKDDDVC